MSRFAVVVAVLGLSGVAPVGSAATHYDAVAQFSTTLDPNNPWQYRSTGGFGGYSTYQAPSQSVAMTPQGAYTTNNTINGTNYVTFDGASWTGGTQLSISGGWWRNTSFGQADFASTHTGIHLHPHIVGSQYPYWRVDPMLVFKPTLTETTTFDVNFKIASDYDLNSAQDMQADGQYVAFYKNDLVIDSDSYWPEDNNAATGAVVNAASNPTGSNGDGWVYVPGWFARYSAPIAVSFQVTLSPGDSLSFRVNSGISSNAYDGIFLPEASISVVPEPTTLGAAAAMSTLLGRRRRA